jgi:glycosyltransferase involved in cell wall biosynthesis
MSDRQLDIILPCYNPLPDWADRIVEAYKALSDSLGFEAQLILVDDGSSNGLNPAQLDQIRASISNFKFLQNARNEGKGAALRLGVEASKADLCIYTDVDFPYTQESFLSIYNSLNSGADICIAVKGEGYYKNVPAGRRAISKLLQRMTRFFLAMPVADTQCGLKGFNNAGRKVFLKTQINRYLFDLEFVFLASRNKNLKFESIAAKLEEGIEFSPVRMSIIFNEAGNFFKVWIKSLFGK